MEDRPLGSLVYAALEAHAQGGDASLERLLAEHPERAEEVRAHVARLRGLGLLDPLDPATAAGAARPDAPDRLGGFRLLERLGEGGMGIVWVAEEVALGRRVALKMIRPEQLWFAGARERFRREVEAIARLSHPGIVPVHAAGEDGGVPYFTMELVDGCTLADVLETLRGADPARLSGADLARALERSAPAPEDGRAARGAAFDARWTDACLTIVRQVAEALDYAHGRGLVHRDVKPSNIALTRSGRALLFDFGLALDGADDRLTQTGARPGSLPYMAPEQVAGLEAGPRTDVYALGATLYELLTLRPAFAHPVRSQLERAIVAGVLRRPRAIAPRLSAEVEIVVLKAMAKEPGERYASADDLARDLGNLLARRPIEARRSGPLLRLARWAQRHPRASAALVAAVPLAVLATAAFAWLERSRSAEILRLADVRRVADLAREAEELWPATPALVPVYEGWLARAEALAVRLPLHRATLASLAGRAGEVLAAERARSRGDEVLWQKETLEGLIAGIERLHERGAGAADSVRSRLAFARDVEQRTLASPLASARWDEAVRSIADPQRSPAYRGLAIRPQLGLLPLGADPRSGLWEFAALASGEEPPRAADGRLVLSADSAIVLVLLPGGRFRMGSVVDPECPDRDPLAVAKETPAHEVELDPFFLAKHVVTQSQWTRMTGQVLDGDPLAPVAEIDWNEARRACERVGLVLPTEAQWEYGARGGTTTPWWTGREKESLFGAANLLDRSVASKQGGIAPGDYETWLDDGFVYPSPVDALRANPFGLHDVAGNVAQWCRDVFAPYTTAVRPGDGERVEPAATNRVMRGGSCANVAALARAAARSAGKPETSVWILGFRAARALER